MKLVKLIFVFSISLLLFSCSEDLMDEINAEQNSALEMYAKNMIPDAILKTAFETTGTDIAWYATVYVEHSAGTWAQSSEADRRTGQESSSLFNNNWNSLYDVMNICKTIMKKTDPITGDEPDNYWVRGIAQILSAYNLAVATDMWGEVPWTEACLGTENLKPKYDRQSDLYVEIQALLDSGIVNMTKATRNYPEKDYLFGNTSIGGNGSTTLANSKAAWTRFAYSLKARYYMRLSQRNATASADALAAIANGYTSAAQYARFASYVSATVLNSNPWFQFWYDRTHLSVGQTLYDIMNTRNDPRIPLYFYTVGGVYVPAPNGAAVETQGGVYSTSRFSSAIAASTMTAPTPLMTYHEMLFIQAEALFRTGGAYQAALQAAVEQTFLAKGSTVVAGTAYYTAEVAPRLTVGNELNEIMTQKYIAMYEAEAMEAYNDYRRTGIPTMHNPANATTGFVNRFPYALSETSSNSANVPTVDIYADEVWWAGGTEKF